MVVGANGWRSSILAFGRVEAGDGAGSARRGGVDGGEVAFVDEGGEFAVRGVVEYVFVPSVLVVETLDWDATVAEHVDELAIVGSAEQ